MANQYAGMFNQLAAAFHELSLKPDARNVMLSYATTDLSPEVEAPFSVINTNIVASTGNVTDLASGDSLTYSDVILNPGPVTLNRHPTYGFPLPSFDLSRGASDSTIRKLRDEAVKKLGDYMNGIVAALVTTAKFNAYTAVNTATDDNIPDSAMGQAWATLAGNDIPVGDLGNLFLVTKAPIYARLLQNPSWTQQAYIGDISSGIRQSARLGLQWGAITDFDNDLPGPTAGAYNSLLFHRHAIALVARSLAPPINRSIPCSYVNYRGVPVRVIIDFDQRLQADVMTFDALMGAEVVRPDHGIIITTT